MIRMTDPCCGRPHAGSRDTLSQAVRAALLLMSCALAPQAHAVISQESLIVKELPVVEPNLMFTLDDSGSMSFNFLPDTDLDDHLFAMHPAEPRTGYTPWRVQGLLGTGDNDLLAARKRSPQVNTLYYDPDVRYDPWVDGTGVRMPNADPRKVKYHLGHSEEPIAALTMDITGLQPVHQPGMEKPYEGTCVRPQLEPKGGLDCSVVDRSVTMIAPATYYLLKNPDNKPPVRWTLGDFQSSKDSASNYQRVSIMDHKEFVRANTRTDCKVTSPGASTRTCTQAEEYQNFANWFQYHRTRMHVAIAAVGNAFATALGKDIRVGYGRINKSAKSVVDDAPTSIVERGVRRFEGEDRSAFFKWLSQRTAKGGTPLMSALETVNKYFERRDYTGPWAKTPGKQTGEEHLACRRSYHILMTDGQYTFYNDSPENYTTESDNTPGEEIVDDRPGSSQGKVHSTYQYQPVRPFMSATRGTLADYAMDAWKRDLRPDLKNLVTPYDGNPSFWQNVTTYTLGFGVEGNIPYPDGLKDIMDGTREWPSRVEAESPSAVDDLWHAAINGHGKYVNVRNSSGFLTEMAGILADISSRTGSTSGVAVASRALQANNQKFVPSFKTKDWTGDLTAYAVDAAGNQGARQWSVLDYLPKPIDRRMYVGTGARSGAASSAFYWDTMSQEARKALVGGAGKGEGDGSKLVMYLRGDRTESGKAFREQLQSAVIGHIINSQPVYIGAPVDRGYRYLPAAFGNTPSGAKSYTAYVAQKVARSCSTALQGGAAKVCGPTMVFVGSNEGFLHGFNANPDPTKDGGREIFAFAPYASLSQLGASSRSGFKARFMMDGPLIERDAYWGGKWRNVVVGTTGAGPKAMFAMDVTNTDFNGLKDSVLWELSDANQAVQAHGDAIGHVLQEPEVGVLADGRWVVVTGNGYESRSRRAQLLVIELSTGNVLARLDTGVGSNAQPNGLGGVTLARDGNQVITAAYAGDLHGNLWKFDLASKTVSDWKVSYGRKPMFTTDDERPITAPPTTVTHPLGGVMVLVGTGKLFEVGDNKRPDTSRGQALPVESIYGLWDYTRLVSDEKGQRAWVDGRQKDKDGVPIARSTVKTRKLNVIGSRYLAQTPFDDKANGILDWRKDSGWRIRLVDMIAIGGQRNIIAPQLMSGLALFETMSPFVDEAQGACLANVNTPGFSLVVDPLSGLMSPKSLIDTNRDRKINEADLQVAGWSVENWTGRSVILAEKPPKPCEGAGCKSQAQTTSVCPPDSLASSLQNVGDGKPVCVGVPSPTRWWWRELAIPDITYNPGALPTAASK